jgi:glutathione S-transferase
MFTIYGRANSSNVRKVLWLCEEIGQTDYERLDYGRGYTPCSSPEYMELNPNMVVPTLVDGDLVLWESNAQLRYLADKHGPEEIYPKDLGSRALVEQWMDWQLTTAIVGVRGLFMGLHIKDEGFTRPELIEANKAQAEQSMSIMDTALAGSGGYIAGKNLTIADCALAIYVHRWYALPLERPDYPALIEYYDRLKQREPFQKWIVGQGV